MKNEIYKGLQNAIKSSGIETKDIRSEKGRVTIICCSDTSELLNCVVRELGDNDSVTDIIQNRTNSLQVYYKQ